METKKGNKAKRAMPRPTVNVALDIRPGPASPAQKAAFRKFFARLIAESRRELSDENEAKHD